MAEKLLKQPACRAAGSGTGTASNISAAGPGRARSPAVRDRSDRTAPAADDAVLFAGELAANSLLYAHDATTVTVAVAVSETFIRIDLCDDGRTGIPHWRETDGDSQSGRGLHLASQAAGRRGLVREQDRTCRRAEVAARPVLTPAEERTAS